MIYIYIYIDIPELQFLQNFCIMFPYPCNIDLILKYYSFIDCEHIHVVFHEYLSISLWSILNRASLVANYRKVGMCIY